MQYTRFNIDAMIALYFESENELKLYCPKARLVLEQKPLKTDIVAPRLVVYGIL